MLDEMLDEVFGVLGDGLEKKLKELEVELEENFSLPESYDIYKRRLFKILEDNRGNFVNKALIYHLLFMEECEKLYKGIDRIFFNFQNLIDIKKLQYAFDKNIESILSIEITEDIYREKIDLLKFIDSLPKKSSIVLEYISIYLLKSLYFIDNKEFIITLKGIEGFDSIDSYNIHLYEQFKNTINLPSYILDTYNGLPKQKSFDEYLNNIFELNIECLSHTYSNFRFNIDGEPYDINEFFAKEKRKTPSLYTIDEALIKLFKVGEVNYTEIRDIYNNNHKKKEDSSDFYDLYNKSIKPSLNELRENFNNKKLGVQILYNEEHKLWTLQKQ